MGCIMADISAAVAYSALMQLSSMMVQTVEQMWHKYKPLLKFLGGFTLIHPLFLY